MAESVFDLQAALCQTMSNANRLRIVHALRQGPLAVGEIAHRTGLAQAKVSQDLALLRTQGVVSAERQGMSVMYHITDPKIAVICDLMREMLANQATHRAELLDELNELVARQ